MDGKRFDDLSRVLAMVLSRQGFVRLTSAAGSAVLAGLGIVASRDTQEARARKKRKKRRRGRERNRRCPGKHDDVCHCPPGLDGGNCHRTGNGSGHENHELDCCCTIGGHHNPRCSCDGDACCKPAGTGCANASQCCGDLACSNGVCGMTPSCVPLTCADIPDQCGTFDDGCQGEIDCACPSGGCCDGVCVDGAQCCQANDCPRQPCQERACNAGVCEYTPANDNQPGPLCVGQGQSCCNGDECCAAGAVCLDIGCCSPQTEDEACAGSDVACGIVSDGCGGEFDCGDCASGRTCMAGACVSPSGGRKKRCKGHGLAGQPCRGSNKKGKKCKCKAGRRCHNKKCCEPKGDGSRHCNADSDCCPGLRCLRRRPDQHKVCVSGGARSGSVPPLMLPPSAG